MLSRARRLTSGAIAERYDWGQPALERPAEVEPPPPSVPELHAAPLPDRAALERDAFLKGYAQGEKTGAEAGAKRAEGMLRRLGETLEELTTLREEMVHRTERQMVQLALAIAQRIVRREISLDRGLLVGMARAALDQFGEHASATIRLHPDDYVAATASLPATATDAHFQIVADPMVSRGSCLVQSDFGFMDVSPEAQFDELARALLDDGRYEMVPVAAGGKHGAVSS